MIRDGAELLVGSFDTVGNCEGNDDILGVDMLGASVGSAVVGIDVGEVMGMDIGSDGDEVGDEVTMAGYP